MRKGRASLATDESDAYCHDAEMRACAEAISRTPGPLALIGAGISIASGYPSWTQLLSRLADRAQLILEEKQEGFPPRFKKYLDDLRDQFVVRKCLKPILAISTCFFIVLKVSSSLLYSFSNASRTFFIFFRFSGSPSNHQLSWWFLMIKANRFSDAVTAGGGTMKPMNWQ
jgi:hypothetical protein